MGSKAVPANSISFTDDGLAPSKSNFRKGSASSQQWRKAWGRIREFEATIGWLARAAGAIGQPPDEPAEIYIVAAGQKIDLDNICKALIDALVGVAIKTDSQRHLIGVHVVRQEESARKPQLRVTVRYDERRDREEV